jgi:hypothetical protein
MVLTIRAFLLRALVLALPVGGQWAAPAETAQEVLEAGPLCDPDLIDATFTFASLPAGEQTVSLHFQNKSNAACRLHGRVGLSFVPVPSFELDGRDRSCWLCDRNDTPSPRPEQQPGNQILLAPGERATLDLHWASTGESCQWSGFVHFSFDWAKRSGYDLNPSNWPMHICSAPKSAGYRAEANSRPVAEMRDGLLHVSVAPAVIYSDETATLHAELPAKATAVVSPAGCATLYTVRHEPSMVTRFDPLIPISPSSRPSWTPEQIQEDKEREWPTRTTDHLRRCDIEGGRTTADAYIRAADLANVTHVEWHTAPGPGEDSVFFMAATHFSVLDVETLAPNWGDPVKGIRAGLSVDRVRFKLGERVPLHLRWENVDAAMPLAQGECMDPEPALEIQDSQHKVVHTIPGMRGCMGHGWGPFAMEKGKPQRAFFELAIGRPTAPTLGVLPGPGVYYLVSVWSPPVLEAPDAETGLGRFGKFGKVYATARSLPVRIEVAPAN